MSLRTALSSFWRELTVKSAPKADWQAALVGQEAWPGLLPSEDQAQRRALTLSWVYSDIQVIARECSQASIEVFESKGEETEPVRNHPFEALFNNKPHPVLTRSWLMQYTVIWLLLRGNAYLWLAPNRAGELVEIWPVPANRCQAIPDAQDFVGGYRITANGQTFTIPPQYVVHLMLPNPYDQWEGLSPVSAYRLAVESDVRAQEVNVKFYSGGKMIPTAIVSTPPNLSPAEFGRFRAELRAELELGDSRILTVPGGDLSVATIGMSQKDADYLANRAFTAEEIDRVYDIPPGFWSKTADRANAEAADRALKEKAVWPLLLGIAEALTLRAVQPCYGQQYVARFRDVRPVDRQLSVSEAGEYGKAMTVAEYRQKYLHLPPLGDERDDLLVAELRTPGGGGGGAMLPETSTAEREARADLKRWEGIELRRLKSGLPPGYDFQSEHLDEHLKNAIKGLLAEARSAEEVKAAFVAPFRLLWCRYP